MLILTERTPNPEALKFIPPTPLAAREARAFRRDDFEAAASPLAARLFEIPEVEQVFVSAAFVTVTRASAAADWRDLKYAVLTVLAEHMESGEPAVAEAAAPQAEDPIAEEIRQVLGLYVRPGVARDGGDIVFERFEADTGVLWIRMQGACGGCPSARLTLKAGVETIVRRYVPEVLRVEEHVDDADVEPPGARLKRWAARLGQAAASRPRTAFTHAGRKIRG